MKLPSIAETSLLFPAAHLIRIENFDAAQFIDAAQPVTLSWTFPNGIGASIENPATGQSIHDSRILPGNIRFLQIPAETFQLETSYDVWITVVDVTEKNTEIFPQARGFAGYASKTLLQIRTRKTGR